MDTITHHSTEGAFHKSKALELKLSLMIQSKKRILLAGSRLKKNLKVGSILNQEKSPEQDRQDMSKPKHFFKTVKHHFKSKKRICCMELSHLTETILVQEMTLRNVSFRQRYNWMKLQSRLLFLSLLRRSVGAARKFGILPIKPYVGAGHQPAKIKARRWYIIYPDNTFLVFHVSVLLVIMLYLVIFFPLDLAYDLDSNSDWLLGMSIFSYAYFFFDILIGFVLAFERQGSVIDEPYQIVRHYITWWFLIDLLATFPFDMILKQNNLRINNVLKIPKLILIIKSIFATTNPSQKKNKISENRLKLLFSSSRLRYVVKNISLILLFIHLSACVWIFLLRFENVDNWYTR